MTLRKVPTWLVFYTPIAVAITGGFVSAAALAWAARSRPRAR